MRRFFVVVFRRLPLSSVILRINSSEVSDKRTGFFSSYVRHDLPLTFWTSVWLVPLRSHPQNHSAACDTSCSHNNAKTHEAELVWCRHHHWRLCGPSRWCTFVFLNCELIWWCEIRRHKKLFRRYHWRQSIVCCRCWSTNVWNLKKLSCRSSQWRK